VLVLVSWGIGHPMNLVFGSPLDLFSIASAAVIVRAIAADGETNWYEGFLLIGKDAGPATRSVRQRTSGGDGTAGPRGAGLPSVVGGQRMTAWTTPAPQRQRLRIFRTATTNSGYPFL